MNVRYVLYAVILLVILVSVVGIGYWYGSSKTETLKIQVPKTNESIYKNLFLVEPSSSNLISITQDIIGIIREVNKDEVLIDVNGSLLKVYLAGPVDFYECTEIIKIENCQEMTSSLESHLDKEVRARVITFRIKAFGSEPLKYHLGDIRYKK